MKVYYKSTTNDSLDFKQIPREQIHFIAMFKYVTFGMLLAKSKEQLIKFELW